MIADAHVAPERAFVAGRPVRIAVATDVPQPVRVDIVRRRTGRALRTYLRPGSPVQERWSGLRDDRRPAPDGRYAVFANGTRIGGFTLHGHRYPIRGPHADRGGIGYFGAPRSGGRTHEGFDVNAACGTPVAAARGGTVRRSTYDPVLYGNLVIVRSHRAHRDYWYAHLRSRPRVRRGDRIRTGRRLGAIGATGNARSVGCHLHFEIHHRGAPIDPEPELHAWDGWS